MRLKECLSRASLAVRLGQSDYAARLCRAALELFPNHLRAHTILGQVLLEKGQLAEAGGHFEAVLACDPENIVARSGLAVALERQGQLKRATEELQKAFEARPGNSEVRESLMALRSQLDRVKKGLDVTPAAASRVMLKKGRYVDAAKTSGDALLAAPNRVDVALCRAEALWRMGRRSDAEQACREIMRKWPQTIKAKLILAAVLLQKGSEVEGTALLHEALTADPSMLVARGILKDAGLSVPDAEEMMEIGGVDFAPPYEVKAALATGLQIELDEEPAEEDLPLLESKPVFERSGEVLPLNFLDTVEIVAKTVSGAKEAKTSPKTKGLFLIVTSIANLAKKYGQEKMGTIDRKLRYLAEVLDRDGYGSHVLYVDSQEALSRHGLSPVNPRSAEAIKALLGQFERKVADQQVKARYVLLVGGDDIVPFHRLTNPTDDDDSIVLSDAPYASQEVNYYAPSRSVGRLPDEESRSPALLLFLIDSIAVRHTQGTGQSGRKRLFDLFSTPSMAKRNGKMKSLGYSALVWRPTTEAVYGAIGEVRTLRISPPMTERSVEPSWFDGNGINLFNLHGAENSPFWYGQKDASYPADYPLFPIALSPDIVRTLDVSNSIILSEACYGANIIKKTAGDSLALQFLKSGAACVIGSTKIAYGSGEPPLVGADLLAKLIWQQLSGGASVGEALSAAKVTFTREVQQRQGYLDGDDQKTVLEFVLLGDPSLDLAVAKPKPKMLEEEVCEDPDFCPSLYCKRKSEGKEEARASGEVMAKVRRFLQKSAPDIFDNQLSILPREVCLSGKRKTCQGSCLLKEDRREHAGTYLVTTKRAILAADGAHIRRVARVTVDPQGSILKLAVSK